MKPVVLHVEDDPNDTLLVTLAFRKLDLASQLRSINNSQTAMAYLSGAAPFASRNEHPLPAFMFLDLKLNGSSGFELLSWVRGQASLRYLPIIVLSSSARSEDVSRAYDLGANSYIPKPNSLEGIMEMVRTSHRYWMGLNQFSLDS